jgi:hypothetical protein
LRRFDSSLKTATEKCELQKLVQKGGNQEAKIASTKRQIVVFVRQISSRETPFDNPGYRAFAKSPDSARSSSKKASVRARLNCTADSRSAQVSNSRASATLKMQATAMCYAHRRGYATNMNVTTRLVAEKASSSKLVNEAPKCFACSTQIDHNNYEKIR